MWNRLTTSINELDVDFSDRKSTTKMNMDRSKYSKVSVFFYIKSNIDYIWFVANGRKGCAQRPYFWSCWVRART